MRIKFRDDDLQRLYVDASFRIPRYGSDVVKAFCKKVAFIQAAEDERDLRNYKALHYEKLTGDRSGQRSVRLNKQWRLIIELQTDAQGRLVVVIEIADYH